MCTVTHLKMQTHQHINAPVVSNITTDYMCHFQQNITQLNHIFLLSVLL